jgi:hypothetical protein
LHTIVIVPPHGDDAKPDPGSLAPLETFRRHLALGELAYTVDAAGDAIWPPRVGLAWRISAGLGTVYATTENHPRDGETRNVSLVDLDEGFRMMSTVLGGSARVGMRVRVQSADGIAVFVPA